MNTTITILAVVITLLFFFIFFMMFFGPWKKQPMPTDPITTVVQPEPTILTYPIGPNYPIDYRPYPKWQRRHRNLRRPGRY